MKKVLFILISLQLLASLAFSIVMAKDVNLSSAEKIKVSLVQVTGHQGCESSEHSDEHDSNNFCDHCFTCQPVFFKRNLDFPKSQYFPLTVTFHFVSSSYSTFSEEILQPPKKSV